MKHSKKAIAPATIGQLILIMAGTAILVSILFNTRLHAQIEEKSVISECYVGYLLREAGDKEIGGINLGIAKPGAINPSEHIPGLCQTIVKDVKAQGKGEKAKKQHIINSFLKDSIDVLEMHYWAQKKDLFAGLSSNYNPCFIGKIITPTDFKEPIPPEEFLQSFEKIYDIKQATDSCYAGGGVCIPKEYNCGNPVLEADLSQEFSDAGETSLKFYNTPGIYNKFFEKESGKCNDIQRPKCCVAQKECFNNGGACMLYEENDPNKGCGKGSFPEFTAPYEGWHCSNQEICCVKPQQYITYAKFIDTNHEGPNIGHAKFIVRLPPEGIQPDHAYGIAFLSPHTKVGDASGKQLAISFLAYGTLFAAAAVYIVATGGLGAIHLGIVGVAILATTAGVAGGAFGMLVTEITVEAEDAMYTAMYSGDHNILIISELEALQRVDEENKEHCQPYKRIVEIKT